MRYWYNNAQRFSEDIERAKILVEANERLFEGVATTPYLLLMNGVDHLEAQDNLLPILNEVNKLLPADKAVKQYLMQDYVDAVKSYIKENNIELPVHKGELREGGDWSLLKGTLSSRSYLKIANVKAQTMLENRLEPLYSMLELAGAKEVYSNDHFRYMWKDLMKNHPHDSICGCSHDEVHAHMEDNYARLSDTCQYMLEQGMRCAAMHLDTNGANKDGYIIAVSNTAQRIMSGVCEVTVDIMKRDEYDGFDIVDGDGNRAEFQVISKEDAVRDGFSPLNLPGCFAVDRYKIQLKVNDINPFSIRGYVIKRSKTENVLLPKIENTETILENENLKVIVNSDGSVDIFNKKSECLFKNVLDIEDSADRGDAYVHLHTDDPAILGSAFDAEVKVLQKNGFVQEISIRRNMALPAYYDFASMSRSKETFVTAVTLTLKLTACTDVLEVGFCVDNKSKDHRIRLLVNTGVLSELAIADIPFDIVAHSEKDHWPDTQSKVLPNSTFALLENDVGGFAVLTEGTHEFEHIGKTLAFTLVRATGVISRGVDFKCTGGDQWYAPCNQCIGETHGRIGLYLYSGGYIGADVPVKSVQFRVGLTSYYTSYDEHKFMQGRTAVQDTRLEELFFHDDPYEAVRIPDNKSLVSVEGAGMLITALKKSQDEMRIVLRGVNLSEYESEYYIRVNGNILKTDISEQAYEPVGKNIVNSAVEPKKIVTYKITGAAETDCRG